jgi:hypothetical protein
MSSEDPINPLDEQLMLKLVDDDEPLLLQPMLLIE